MNTDYPRMLFHRTKSPVTVQTREEEAALGKDWARTIWPAATSAAEPEPAPAVNPIPEPPPCPEPEPAPEPEVSPRVSRRSVKPPVKHPIPKSATKKR
jgi:hypothetical protein